MLDLQKYRKQKERIKALEQEIIAKNDALGEMVDWIFTLRNLLAEGTAFVENQIKAEKERRRDNRTLLKKYEELMEAFLREVQKDEKNRK